MTCGPTGAQGLTTNTNILTLSSAWTAGFWCKLTTVAACQSWLIWESPGGGDYTGMQVTAAGTPQFWVDGGTTVTIGGGNMGTTNWESFWFVHDGAGTVTVYRSIAGAALVSRLTQAVAYTGVQNQLVLMNDETVSSTRRWRGQLYGYKEWQVALTATQLSYEAFKAYPTKGPPNRFIPAFNDATAIRDYSGQGRDMTKTGTLTNSTLVPPIQYGGAQVAIIN